VETGIQILMVPRFRGDDAWIPAFAGMTDFVAINVAVYKHIVNLQRIRIFHAVNVELGYPVVSICTPWEVLEP
jgi:hypothetical protein